MKRFSKTLNGDDPSKYSDSGTRNALTDPDRNPGLSPMRVMGIFIACLILFSVLFSINVVLRDPPSDAVHEASKNRVLEVEPRKSSEDQFLDPEEVPKDKLLGGLLAAGFDEGSCASRYQSASYRKEMPHEPSSYLLSRLRSYEALHKRCGPNTESYKKAVEQLKSGRHPTSLDCNYVVWISYSGLGNRILTLASAFLYALLTNRVLLVDPGVDMVDLFCEPFPEASWFLPMDFPLKNQFGSLNQKSAHCYGEMVRKSNLTNTDQSLLSSFVYLHLSHDYNDQDKLFFCDQDQDFLEKIPWLIVRTDNYFVPSLFLIPSFEQELGNLFPRKETVFHFLGRYLFHPTNVVWGLITRYYQAYLAKADERIGIQIRVFDTGTGPFQHVFDQILSCALKENLLPETNGQDLIVTPSGTLKSKAVLITSLSSGYLEKLRDMYWEHPTVTGEVIGIYQPSHEEYQQTEKHAHNRKAWAEMYLLSLTDMLITSSWSTFGYVAQSLGGLTPWILYKPENRTAPDPACKQAMSMEPCFHAPPFYDCKAKTGVDTGALVPHVRHCEDMSWGLKLIDRSDEF
ncbi:putative Type 1 galactoside alpha-(1,2)-fucosyltransferase [Rosa chinensis]|uniref:Fucosyltransferase n=1 Tax=Rosa chinensis TaxID=74649 RepID=A0A2P6P2R8_ROSCH|nr:galactoside 2-alpha-L-fucosyltransferase [Rosa chinensis]PRQ16220.1 putative Type 1 galactoside alpha-(1,2)-fucosyltransferase [Rosa chinensis]